MVKLEYKIALAYLVSNFNILPEDDFEYTLKIDFLGELRNDKIVKFEKINWFKFIIFNY